MDVISPNADEFMAFFEHDIQENQASRAALFLEEVQSRRGCSAVLVIREGAGGCSAYLGTKHLHLRAFHQGSDAAVRDPTGGGNTFLGALAFAMTRNVAFPLVEEMTRNIGDGKHSIGVMTSLQTLVSPLIQATVAASFAIEQSGMPVLSSNGNWNGESFEDRLSAYVHRDCQYILDQFTTE